MSPAKTFYLSEYATKGMDDLKSQGFNMSEIVTLGIEWILQQLSNGKKTVSEIRKELEKSPSPWYLDYLEKVVEDERRRIEEFNKSEDENIQS
jgi:hypothetical protein